VPVFPLAVEVHLGLRLPCLGVADNHQDAENWSDADRDVVRPVCPDMEDAILEVRRDRMAAAVGKLAAHEPRPVDAVPDRPGSAWALFPELPAWDALAERLVQRLAAAEPYTQDVARSAA
jgi:hypothetical protein